MKSLLLSNLMVVGFFLATNLELIAQNLPFSQLDVFELEWVNDPQISPDGQSIVYGRGGMNIMKDRRQSRLWIIHADGSGNRKLTSREVAESQARWSPDGNRLAFVSSTEEGSEIYMYWLASGVSAKLTQLNRSPKGLSWSPDGKHLAFTMHVPEAYPFLTKAPTKPKGANWAQAPRITTRLKHEADGAGYMEPGYSHIFIVSAEGGTARQISKGDFHFRGPLSWTPDGQHLIFSSNLHPNWEYDYRNSEIYSIAVKSGTVDTLTDRKGPDHSPQVSPDGKAFAYLGYDDKVQTYQLTKLYTQNLNGNSKREISFPKERSINAFQWDEQGRGFYLQYDSEGNTHIGHLSLSGKFEEIASNLGGTAIGRPYGGGSFSLSSTGKIAFTHTTPYHPSELAILSQGGQEVQVITQLNGDLLPHRNLGKVEEIWYKSSIDQLNIQGWLVKPPNFDSTNVYPLLVENHGGPISNYGDRFSPEIQLYASAGFVVFYPNPRGSTSYGEDFGNELYHNYPGDDYQDVMDGVDELLKRNYLSEDSLFVTGGSAGGIMTAWIIGKNQRFRSAAVIKPVMNWVSKTLTADNYYGYAHYRYPGQPWENMEAYMKFSPLSLVGNIQTPTLVMVGTSDLRTPLSEAKQLYHALKLQQVETALVEMPGAFHFISNRPSQLIAKIDHIVAWFNKYRK